MDIMKFFHEDYVSGEELPADEKHYAKTGRIISDKIDE